MGIITDILKEIPLSAVLKERLTEMEAKMAILENENTVLKAENTKLCLNLQNTEHENKQLKQTHDTPLRSDNDHKILELLAKQPNIPVEQIAQTLNHNLEQTKYEIEELSKIGFINFQMTPFSPFNPRYSKKPVKIWHLDQNGRGYMIKHGLLK